MRAKLGTGMYIPSKLQQEQLSLRGRRVDQEVGATDTRRKFFLVAYTLPSLITAPFSRVALQQVLSPQGVYTRRKASLRFLHANGGRLFSGQPVSLVDANFEQTHTRVLR